MDHILYFMCLLFLISTTFSDHFSLSYDVTTSRKSSLEPPLGEFIATSSCFLSLPGACILVY